MYFYLYSILRDVAVARKHILAGTVAAEGQASRTEELPVSANLVVASLAGMGNVLATNPIWCVLKLPSRCRRPSELKGCVVPVTSCDPLHLQL